MFEVYSEESIRQLASDYATHGVVYLPGFLQVAAVKRLNGIVSAARADMDHIGTEASVSSVARSDGRLTLRYLWRDNTELRQILLQPGIARAVARIIGSKTLRFWFDLTFVHYGSATGCAGVGTPWHHDVPTYSFKGDLMPSLWLALSPTDAMHSRMMFIDGSHRANNGYYRSPEVRAPMPGTNDGFVDLPDFDAMLATGEARLLTWDCRPGDAILLHPCTIHGARGHDGIGAYPERIAMTTRWLGDDVRFLPHSYERALKHPAIAGAGLMFGQRPHGDWFPLVYDEAIE